VTDSGPEETQPNILSQQKRTTILRTNTTNPFFPPEKINSDMETRIIDLHTSLMEGSQGTPRNKQNNSDSESEDESVPGEQLDKIEQVYDFKQTSRNP